MQLHSERIHPQPAPEPIVTSQGAAQGSDRGTLAHSRERAYGFPRWSRAQSPEDDRDPRSEALQGGAVHSCEQSGDCAVPGTTDLLCEGSA